MAPVDDGDGWGRPPAAPPGTPRFEPAPVLGQPGVAPPRPPSPTAATASHRPAPPPGWAPPPGAAGWTPPPAGVAAGTGGLNGWLWAAIVFVALIPIGLVVAVGWLFRATSAAAADDPDGMSGEWLPLAAMAGFVAWTACCAVAATACTVIGGFRARRT